MAIERKDRIVRYDILEYFKRAQDALNRRLYALKRELQALADKYSRLDTVETGAEVNVINGVKVKNEDITTVDGKVVTIDLGDYTKSEVTEALKAKLDGIHEFASEVVVNPQREDGVTLAHISVNGEDKFIKRGAIEYGELEHIPATFPPSEHNHDERYYGKAETESKLDLKSDVTHLHDDRYYTESEIDSKVNTINTSINNKSDKTHTHDDRYYTESEINNKVNTINSSIDTKADKTHTHDDRYYTESEADNLLSQKSDIGHTHSQYLTAGSMLNTANLQGIISVDNLPNAALERLVNVADDTARFALTEASVQLGDTVKVANTGLMYIIKDISKLNSEAGYEVYTAGSASSVPWSGVTGKPSSYTPSAHTHDDRYYTESEIDSKVNTINSSIGTKADKTHTHDDRYYTESEIDSKLAGKQGSLTATGSATKGMYIDSSGTAKAMAYSVNKDVPSDAKFTDTVYTHPTTAGNKHIPSGGSSGQILRWSADGTAAWGADNNTTYSPATQSDNGLMSAADKAKLDGIATGANAYTHPNSGVTVGTYRNVTVNAQGHVTAGSNPTTLSGYGITDAPTKTGGGASGTWGISISGNAATANTIKNLELGTTDVFRNVWFSDSRSNEKPVYNTGIQYNPATNVLKTGTFQGTLTGNAASATKATALNIFAHRPSDANIQKGDGLVRYFLATNSMTSNKPMHDAKILHLAWDNNGGWDAQLAITNNDGEVQTRAQIDGTWGKWKTFLNEKNYNTYAPKKDGTGASGTWGINISGNVNGVSITKDSSGNIIIS